MQSIIEDGIPCPRCNADSQKRVEEKDNFLVIMHICPMCRYRKSLGITSRRALKLEKRLDYWNQLLSSANKIEETYKILARIEVLQKQIDKERLGIGA